MSGIFFLIMLFVFIYALDIMAKGNKSINRNKHITDISYQKYASFYGEEAHVDLEFKNKLEKILNMITKDKCEDLVEIAKQSNCTYLQAVRKGVTYEMEIIRSASAGTMESSDAYVEIEPANELSVNIESVVAKQFGDKIDAAVREVLLECGVKSADVRVVDRGALECVIRARVETAVKRSGGAK